MSAAVDLHCGHCAKALGAERIFAHTSRGPRYCQPCWQVVNAEEIAREAACDRWHEGYFAKVRPSEPDALKGYLQAQADRRRPAPTVVRPEGYYHMPLGTFE